MQSPKRAAPAVPQLNGRTRKTSCNTSITASGSTMTPVPQLKINGHSPQSHLALLNKLDDAELINDRPMLINMTFSGLKEAQQERVKTNAWSSVPWGDLKEATRKRNALLKQCAPAMSTPVREPREPRRRVTISPQKERTNKVLLSSPARCTAKPGLTLQTKLKRPLDDNFSFREALKPTKPTSATKLTPPMFHKSKMPFMKSETHSLASSLSMASSSQAKSARSASKSHSKSKSTSNLTNTTTSSGASLSKPKKRRVNNINYNKARQQAPPDRYTKSTSSIISSKYNESSLADIEDGNTEITDASAPGVYYVSVRNHLRMTKVSCMRKYERHLRSGFNSMTQKIDAEEAAQRPIKYYTDNLANNRISTSSFSSEKHSASASSITDSFKSPKRRKQRDSESMSCDSSQVSQTSLPSTPTGKLRKSPCPGFSRVSAKYDPWEEKVDFDNEYNMSIYENKKLESLLKKSKLAVTELPDVSELDYPCDSLQQHEEKIEPFMEKLRLKEKRLKKRDDQWLKSRSSLTPNTPEKVNPLMVPVSHFVIEHPRATIDGDMKGASFYPPAREIEEKHTGNMVYVIEKWFYSCKQKKFRHKEPYQPSWILTPIDLQKMKTHTAQTEKYLQLTTTQMKKKLKLESDI